MSEEEAPATPVEAAFEPQDDGLLLGQDMLLDEDALRAQEVKNELRRLVEEQRSTALVRVKARQAVYDKVYEPWAATHGKHVSKKDRDTLGIYTSSLIYGEINYESFGNTLEKIRSVYGKAGVGSSGGGVMQHDGSGVFYDLGSGAGKPTIAAATLFAFGRSAGLEYLPGLVQASNLAKARFDDLAPALLRALPENPTTCEQTIEFLVADITDPAQYDWSDGDVVFANSTCFDDPLLEAIAGCASRMKKGSFFITFTKKLPSEHFEICESELHQMSWGAATVFIQQKTTDPIATETPPPIALSWELKASKSRESASSPPPTSPPPAPELASSPTSPPPAPLNDHPDVEGQ